MISSLASVLVANANATPENVVPCCTMSQQRFLPSYLVSTYKVNADNELRLAAVTTLHLCQVALVRVRSSNRRAITIRLLGTAMRIAWRRWRLLSVHLLLVLRRIGMAAAGVDWRWRHGTAGSALVRMLRCTETALVCVLVRRRSAELLLLRVHGERGGRG